MVLARVGRSTNLSTKDDKTYVTQGFLDLLIRQYFLFQPILVEPALLMPNCQIIPSMRASGVTLGVPASKGPPH